MTKHIDTLAEWWENAEEGTGKAGDVVIEHDDSPNSETPSYVVFTLGRDEHENLTYLRVLHRAPAPKPAWHDAVAVIATCHDAESDITWEGVWVPEGAGVWEHQSGVCVGTESLCNVTPLIEQKVTDEMVDRLEHHFAATQQASLPVGFAEKMLNIALGLDPA